MASIEVTIRTAQNAATPIFLPDDVTIGRLIPAIVTKLGLLEAERGQHLTYQIFDAERQLRVVFSSR